MTTLQYQLANGEWMDCNNDRVEYFLSLCEENNGIVDGKIVPRFRAEQDLTRSEVLDALSNGITLRNDRADWYSNCRYEPAPIEQPSVEMVSCDCGCTVPVGSRMNASLGTTCPDCYDDFSG